VLDPFVGSGTSVVAALQSGRSAIGIDLNSEYCRYAAEWIIEATEDLGLTPSSVALVELGSDPPIRIHHSR
jgi:tRNA G10  N-methylase Trm11